uniref:Phage head morphogenesis domain-containing protein n=1 Tax=candidate division WOR-3 bacterium TaxID=2052148 RepID=A0A7C6A805_UNCW3
MDLEFESTQSFNRLKQILLDIRDKVLAELAYLPQTEVYRYRFLKNYIKELERIIDGQIQQTPQGIKVITKPLADRLAEEIPVAKVFEDAHYEGVQELKTAGFYRGFPMIDEQALAFLEDYKLDLIKRISNDLREGIKSQLRLGIIQSEGVSEIAKRIRNQHSIIADRTERIVRTELARAQSEGHNNVYQKIGVTRVQVIGRGIDCPICSQHIGKIYRFDSAPRVPLHPNCRCDIVAVERGDGNWFVTERQIQFVKDYPLPENISIALPTIRRIAKEHPEPLYVWPEAAKVITQGSRERGIWSRQYAKPLIKNLRIFKLRVSENKILDAWLEK